MNHSPSTLFIQLCLIHQSSSEESIQICKALSQYFITVFHPCHSGFFFLNMEPFVNIDEYPILVPLSLLLSHSSSPFLLFYSNIPMDLLLGCLPSPGSPPFLNGESQPCSCSVSLGLPCSSDAAM